MKKNVTMLSGMVVRSLFTFLADPDPQGQEIAQYGDFRPFWPRAAFGTYRNPGRGLKTEKRNFPALGVPKPKKKLPRYPGWLPATFLCFMFWPTGPPWVENRKIRIF